MEDHQKQWDDAVAKIRELQIKMPPEQSAKLDKALSIYECMMNTAKAVANAGKLYPFTKKQIFPAHNRRPRNKQKRALAAGMMGFTAYIGAYQALSIMQQPVPKYPKGGEVAGGIAIVGEGSSEKILQRDIYISETREIPYAAFEEFRRKNPQESSSPQDKSPN